MKINLIQIGFKNAASILLKDNFIKRNYIFKNLNYYLRESSVLFLKERECSNLNKLQTLSTSLVARESIVSFMDGIENTH